MRKPSPSERDGAIRALSLDERQAATLSERDRELLGRLALAGVMEERMTPAQLREAQAIIERCGCAEPAADEARRRRIDRPGALRWRNLPLALGLATLALATAYLQSGDRRLATEPQPATGPCLASTGGAASRPAIRTEVAAAERRACPAPPAPGTRQS
jgi:hypothetical protein